SDRREVERSVAPLQYLEWLERMAFERLRKLGFERRGPFGGGQSGVAGGAGGTGGGLRPFGRGELLEMVAAAFAGRGERDGMYVEVEPHADGVGSDEVFDVTRLVERDLRIARARAQRPQHHGCASALATDQLGDGIDFLGRERDDGGTAGKPGDLLLARE